MRTLKLTILFLILFIGGSSPATASSSLFQDIGFKKKSSAENDTSDVSRFIHLALSSGMQKKYKIQHMKAYIDSAEFICKKANIEIPAMLHFVRAEYFFLTNDFNNASQEATIALKLSENSGESIVIARTLHFLGRYSLRTGFFLESIDYFTKSIEVAEDNQLNGFIPVSYGGIAEVYTTLGNTEKYRSSLQMMINSARSENDTNHLKSGYIDLGTSYTAKVRDFNRADSLLKTGLKIALLVKDTMRTSMALANLGWNSYLEKKYDASLKFYNRSLSYSIPAKEYFNSANCYGNIGTIYRDLRDTEKSLINYLKAIDQGKLGNDVYNLSWVYQDMSEMYLRKRDTSNAYKSYVLFKKYSDSLMKSNNIQGMMDARIRYETDNHNKELELLSLRIKNQKLLIYGFTGLFILCLAIGILFISRAKLNAKRRISEMNRKISEVTQANLRQQMNPHFIFNTLNSIQYYMYQHDKLATNNYLTKFSSLMRKVLENSQHTAVPLRDELDALNLYLDLEKIRFKDKFDYKIKVDDEIDILLYKVPTMLIQPYVENSICHGLMPGEAKGLIKIDLKLKKEYISCIIEDNGIGREAAQEKKNKCENGHNSLGTQIVSSRLNLVNALYGTSLKTVYTDLKNSDGEAEGTRVEIHIPIMT
ncbi:MAG TPA: histidine kinase [Bacteroidales bacterium]|nr:histidine kinase [Bacteroidales bacterium]